MNGVARAGGRLLKATTATDSFCNGFYSFLTLYVITLALSKGRIFDETLPLLEAAGVRPLENPETSRKLIIGTSRADVRLIIVRASDTPTYVQYGAADLGIAGKDVLLEHGGAGLYQPLDLRIAACRMMVAVPQGFDYARAVQQARGWCDQVPSDAREHFAPRACTST
jgi:ATP phosphoribosyltransferase